MESRAKIAGHPAHPMLVVFPIGLYVISFLFDIVYVVSGDPFWYRAAYWNMLIGLVMNVVAAVPGAIDLYAVVRGTTAWHTGRRHLQLGLLLAGLYLVNILIREGGAAVAGEAPWGPLILNFIGMLFLGAQGWLGGHLVYHFHVGVEPAEHAAKPPRAERSSHEPPLRKVG